MISINIRIDTDTKEGLICIQKDLSDYIKGPVPFKLAGAEETVRGLITQYTSENEVYQKEHKAKAVEKPKPVLPCKKTAKKKEPAQSPSLFDAPTLAGASESETSPDNDEENTDDSESNTEQDTDDTQEGSETATETTEAAEHTGNTDESGAHAAQVATEPPVVEQKADKQPVPAETAPVPAASVVQGCAVQSESLF